MPRPYFENLAIALFGVSLLSGSIASGQSLGDIARANREKQQTQAQSDDQSATPPRVITNADLPKNTDPAPNDAPSQQNASANKAADHRSTQRTAAEQRVAEQWRSKILVQKQKMANLQARIDQLNASMQAANGSAQFDGPSGRGQARQCSRSRKSSYASMNRDGRSSICRKRRGAQACIPRFTIRRGTQQSAAGSQP
jgi:hypothetical protein